MLDERQEIPVAAQISAQVQVALVEFLEKLTEARTMAEVTIAAGIALEVLQGVT